MNVVEKAKEYLDKLFSSGDMELINSFLTDFDFSTHEKPHEFIAIKDYYLSLSKFVYDSLRLIVVVTVIDKDGVERTLKMLMIDYDCDYFLRHYEGVINK